MADASFKRISKQSRLGYTFRIREEKELKENKLNNNMYNNIFCWKSKNIGRLIDSTTAAELMGMKAALKISYKYINFIKKLWGYENIYYVHYTDNLPLLKIIEKNKFDEEPSLSGEVKYCVQCLEDNNATLRWIDTANMVADSLTKFVKV